MTRGVINFVGPGLNSRPVLERVHPLLDWQNHSPEAVADKLTAVRDLLHVAYQLTQPDGEVTT